MPASVPGPGDWVLHSQSCQSVREADISHTVRLMSLQINTVPQRAGQLRQPRVLGPEQTQKASINALDQSIIRQGPNSQCLRPRHLPGQARRASSLWRQPLPSAFPWLQTHFRGACGPSPCTHSLRQDGGGALTARLSKLEALRDLPPSPPFTARKAEAQSREVTLPRKQSNSVAGLGPRVRTPSPVLLPWLLRPA